MKADAVGARIKMNSTGMGLQPLTYIIPDWGGQLDIFAHDHSDLTVVVVVVGKGPIRVHVEVQMMIYSFEYEDADLTAHRRGKAGMNIPDPGRGRQPCGSAAARVKLTPE